MGIRVEHTVHKLPDTYITHETVYEYVKDKDDPKIKTRQECLVEHRGGYLVKFMRGHMLRFFDEDHLRAAGFNGTKPRLIDENSGLECNEQGIPLDVAALIGGTSPRAEGSDDQEFGLSSGDPDADLDAIAKAASA